MSTPSGSSMRGPLAWMANNTVAANLLMFIILIGGALSLFRVKQEVFPQFDLDVINVTVPYPGASPSEVEQGIVLVVEEALRGIDGVKRVTSTSNEGSASVQLELLIDADRDKALAEAKNAIDRITSFPEEIERPTVALGTRTSRVISLVISGDVEPMTLHKLAERARGVLLDREEITQVATSGLPPLEVGIEIPRETLESLGLTLQGVARQVQMASLELPGGSVETAGGEVLVRVADRRITAGEFGDIVVRSSGDGSALRLAEIAHITDGFADTDQISLFNGKPAVLVTAYRVGEETPIKVAAAARAVAETLQSELPETVAVDIWDDDSELLAGRIDLLKRNAQLGLVLVLLVLALFLELRLAFWVALGIPISFLGTFFLMPGLDISINMISLFALIVTLGMVVDDAIVVGESAFHRMQQGQSRMQAAVEGARDVAMPVSFAILTTIAAFSPMLTVPGTMGKIFRIIPMMVITVLTFSWLESFLILPAHLGHGKDHKDTGILGAIENLQMRFSAGLARFTQERYKPALIWVLTNRIMTAAVATAIFIVAVSYVASGRMPWSFMPRIEGDLVTASARLPYGTPVEETERVAALLQEAANKALEEAGEDDIVIGTLTSIGSGPTRGRRHRGGGGANGPHVLSIEVNLVSSESREITSAELSGLWRKHTPPIAGLEALSFKAFIGPGAGAAVDIQLSHRDSQTLADASAGLAALLDGYDTLTEVENTYSSGKDQLDLRLKDEARAVGLTSMDLARQLRSSFFGTEALREQRGRNEVRVMVRLPEEQRRSEQDLDDLRVASAAGGYLPLSAVAEIRRSQAPTSIIREDGRRIINVKAELAPGVKSARDTLKALKEDELPKFVEQYPGLTWSMVGEQREQDESMSALRRSFLIALLVIYGLLAVPFRSYIQPLIVMSAIPYGFVGAVLGHFIMGYGLSFISVLGIIALSGVVVNDSLVLVDAANRKRADGASPFDAIVFAGSRRLRPILLTSLTTFFGLAPMIIEPSVQARFLIPMAISLGFGILFATFIILFLVPLLFLTVEELRTPNPEPAPSDGV